MADINSHSPISTDIFKSIKEIFPWEDTPRVWQEKICQGIAAATEPDYFLSPQTITELAQIVAIAHNHNWRIMPCGSGSKLNWGALVKNPRLVVSTQHLNRIIEHAVDDLTVTVEAGVKLTDLQTMLREKGQFLPLDPTYPQTATIGGIVATADTGSWRQRYGGVRDVILGISFVRSDGKIAKAGGKVVKNVAGYDLMKLFTGSYGTLGIITQVTFRTYPLLDTQATVALSGEKEAIALARKSIFNSSLTPTAADLLSSAVISRLEIGQGMGILLRFQSVAESVKEQIESVKTLGQELGLQVRVYQQEEEGNLWQKAQEYVSVPDKPTVVTCKIGTLPNTTVNILNRLDVITSGSGLGLIHLSSGLGRVYLQSEHTLNHLQQMRSLLEKNRGFLTILDSPPHIKEKLEPWGYTGNTLTLMGQIKQKFDPKNILNPYQDKD